MTFQAGDRTTHSGQKFNLGMNLNPAVTELGLCAKWHLRCYCHATNAIQWSCTVYIHCCLGNIYKKKYFCCFSTVFQEKLGIIWQFGNFFAKRNAILIGKLCFFWVNFFRLKPRLLKNKKCRYMCASSYSSDELSFSTLGLTFCPWVIAGSGWLIGI